MRTRARRGERAGSAVGQLTGRFRWRRSARAVSGEGGARRSLFHSNHSNLCVQLVVIVACCLVLRCD